MQLKEASILVVDDEPVLLEIMGEWFQRNAAQVFCAANGVQALEILAIHKIDLIITDVRMAVMDGITLLRKVKANGLPTPSVILITGFADIDARDAYDLGAEALLEKPIDRDELLKVMQRSLLEPDKRWQKPVDLSAYPVLTRSFASLAAALEEHRIAFGRGGFCIEAGQFREEGPLNIELDFKADGYVLSGQGIVHWLAHQDDQLGIEFTYVTEASRARLIELVKAATSFIPRTTGRTYQALAG
ncbi:MAG TPA: response regulator [Candidatus Angelobacter sp.]|nr:response regulator [Candidatus Angelobacter sp.]